MGRHQFNNSAHSVFSYHERQQLKHWGTKKKRLGADSQLDHDACALCLGKLVEPVGCHKGHVYCKGCVYESLLSQKEHNSAQMARWKEQEEAAQRATGKTAEEAELKRKAEEFAKQEESILPALTTQFGSVRKIEDKTGVPPGYRAVKKPHGIIYVPEETEEKVAKDKALPCYWIPDLIPDVKKTKVEKPRTRTVCPCAPHTLRLKQLRSVRFITVPNEDKSKRTNKGRYMCPCCLKTLTNATKMGFLRGCGHVLCKNCLDQFVRKDLTCNHCAKKVREKDIVILQSGGTSFAGGGSKEVTSTATPAFQCF